MKNFHLVLVSLCAIISTRSFAQEPAETHTLQRPDGTTLTYYITRPDTKSFPIAFNVQGSKCAGYAGADISLVKALNAAVIRVEKRGFPTTESACPDEYLKNHTIYDRVADFKLVITALETNDVGWDHESIYWLGGSEGGAIISLTATFETRSKAIVFLAPAAAGFTFAKERRVLLEEYGSVCETSSQRELKRRFLDILRNPQSTLTWCGDTNTYKWWATILPFKTVEHLKKFDKPIYLAQGMSDDMVPPESADFLAEDFQKLGKLNLTYVKYPGLNHQWNDANGISHAADVYRLAIAWLKSQFTSDL